MSYYGSTVTIVPANVVLRFPVGEIPQTKVPTELQPYYREDVWASRITATCRTANRYHKKAIEWVWLLVGLSSIIAAPIATYYLAYNALPADPADDKNKDKDDHLHFQAATFDRFWKARLISFAVWIAVMLLVIVPMHLWKKKGKTTVNLLLAGWEKEDSAVRPPGMPFPSMRMKMPGILDKSIKIIVNFPPTALAGPSIYQPGSFVPPYLANPPSDPAAQAYYQQPQNYQNGPPTNQMGQTSGFLGQAPLMGGAAPYHPHEGAGYNGPYAGTNRKAENPFADDKEAQSHNPFDDVKV
ncbi:hypothetical protein BC835DRAFT_1304450 [Cytidiella melzeri]|nr:hypothetical protein BC835DRAFT_1304450 [Cytidiella melzeri]